MPNIWDKPLYTPDEFDASLKAGLEKAMRSQENMPLSADEFAQELLAVISHASPISVALDCGGKRTWLALPATAAGLNEALREIGASDRPYFIGDCKVGPDLPLRGFIVGGALPEVDYLAARLAELPPAQMEKLAAVMETPEALTTIKQVIDFTYNTDYYTLTPGIHSAEDLGRHDLYHSELIQMPEEWKSAIDPERLGERIAEVEGGIFTRHGYLCQSGDEWQEVYERSGVIPPEYRVVQSTDIGVQIEIERLKNARVRVEDISEELDYRDRAAEGMRWNDNLYRYSNDELQQMEAAWREPDAYLKNAEMSTEQNYNQINGLIDNEVPRRADLTDGQTHEEIQALAPETLRGDAPRKTGKPSILAALKAAKEEAAAAKPGPAQQRKPQDRDL